MDNEPIKKDPNPVSPFEKANLEALASFLKSELGESLDCSETDYGEKRKALRLNLEQVETWVKFTELIYSEKYEFSKLEDISSVGAKINMCRKVTIAKQAMLRFVFPDLNEFFVYGRVVWIEEMEKGYQYGIQFDKRNSILSEKIIETHLANDAKSGPLVTIEKTPEAFIQAINTFFSEEKRRLIQSQINRK